MLQASLSSCRFSLFDAALSRLARCERLWSVARQKSMQTCVLGIDAGLR